MMIKIVAKKAHKMWEISNRDGCLYLSNKNSSLTLLAIPDKYNDCIKIKIKVPNCDTKKGVDLRRLEENFYVQSIAKEILDNAITLARSIETPSLSDIEAFLAALLKQRKQG